MAVVLESQDPKCDELWLGKAHIPRISKVPRLSKMKATSLSFVDGKRNRITRDDLRDHTWDFHFTACALPRRDVDPNGGAPMRRYFHPDGSIKAGEDDKAWDENEASYTIVTKGNNKMRSSEQYVRINWWPHMSVTRKPDCSWVVSDGLYCYLSIPDADKVDGTGPYDAAQPF